MKPMPASIAIPTIVSGTIVVTLLISFVVLREPLNWNQWLGSGCIVLGIALLFLNREAAPA
jgi:drug/metabolite transporter (DMT)-like permease